MNTVCRTSFLLVMLGSTSLAFADGKEDSENLKLDQLPPAVQAAVTNESATVQEIERETENGQTFYEVEFVKGNEAYTVHIADDGKVLKRENDDE